MRRALGLGLCGQQCIILTMEDSIFTKIIRGEVPSYKIYEDEKVYAMLDIEPLSDGHVLVFPKAQVDLLWDLSDDEYEYLWRISKKIAREMQEVFQPERVGVVIEGFGVPHAHIHLVPLYDRDVLELHHGCPAQKDTEDMKKIAEKLAKKL